MVTYVTATHPKPTTARRLAPQTHWSGRRHAEARHRKKADNAALARASRAPRAFVRMAKWKTGRANNGLKIARF